MVNFPDGELEKKSREYDKQKIQDYKTRGVKKLPNHSWTMSALIHDSFEFQCSSCGTGQGLPLNSEIYCTKCGEEYNPREKSTSMYSKRKIMPTEIY
jgi:hypothetical protein